MGLASANIGTATLRTQLDLTGLRQGLGGADQAVKQATGNWTRDLERLGQVATRFGTVWTLAVTTPLTALAGIGVRSAMQLETFSASLNVLIGDAERAGKVFDELYEFSARTPFDWRTLTDATRVLAAFGVEAEEIMGDLSMLGDIAAGTQSDLTGLAEIYGRVQVTGRISMEEVNSLALRGVPIYTELARVVGVTSEEIRELISSGTIGFPELQEVFRNLTTDGGRFFNMMEEQSKTTQGRLNTLKDTFEQVTDAIGDHFLPTVSRLIDTGQGLVNWFNNLTEAQQSMLITTGSVVAALGPLSIGFGVLLTALSRLPAAITAVRTGFVLLRTTLLPFLGVAGIVASLAAVAITVAVNLAGRGGVSDAAEDAAAGLDELQTASGNATDALDDLKAATDKEGLYGAVEKLAGLLKGDAKSAFVELANQAIESGGDITSVMETIMSGFRAAFAELQRLRASSVRERLEAELETAQAMLENAQAMLEGARENRAALPTSTADRLDAAMAGMNERAAQAALRAGEDTPHVAEAAAELAAALREDTSWFDPPELVSQIESLTGTIESLTAQLAELDAVDLGGGGTGDGTPPPGRRPPPAGKPERTAQDVLNELAARGTAANRIAAFADYDGADPEAVTRAYLAAAQTRANLIERAITELITDFYGVLSREEMEGLRRRLQAAERETVAYQAALDTMAADSERKSRQRALAMERAEVEGPSAGMSTGMTQAELQRAVAEARRRTVAARTHGPTILQQQLIQARIEQFLEEAGLGARPPGDPFGGSMAGAFDQVKRRLEEHRPRRGAGITPEQQAIYDIMAEIAAEELAAVIANPFGDTNQAQQTIRRKAREAIGRSAVDLNMRNFLADLMAEFAAEDLAAFLRTDPFAGTGTRQTQRDRRAPPPPWTPMPGQPEGIGAGSLPGGVTIPAEIQAMIDAGREARYNVALAASDAARIQQEAAQSFAHTVIQAGVAAGLGLIEAIRNGDVGGVLSNLGAGAGSVLGAVSQFGPGMGLISSSAAGPLGLAAAIVPMLASFIAGLIPRRGEDAAAVEQAERLRRQTPSFRMSITNILNWSPGFDLNDQRAVGQIRRIFDGWLEDSMKRIGWENVRNMAMGNT